MRFERDSCIIKNEIQFVRRMKKRKEKMKKEKQATMAELPSSQLKKKSNI